MSSTAIDSIAATVARQPEATAWAFVREGEDHLVVGFGDLWNRVERASAAIQARTATGDRVLVTFPPGLEFGVGFLACLHAGVIAVPTPPVLRPEQAARVRRVVDDCRPVLALGLETQALADESRPLPPSLDWSALVMGDEARLASPRRHEIAFLQYTSGSTGRPKGVVVGHDNLAANVRAISTMFRVTNEDRAVFWLPPYHDMGLVGGVVGSLASAVPTCFMSPMAFVRRPVRWLQMISDWRATISGAPNFAYALCAARLTGAQAEALDLRTWRVAFCGAEPIDQAALEAFADRAAPSGFDRRSFLACYGLAESTLMVTGTQARVGLQTRAADAHRLEAGGHLVAVQGTARPRTLVVCGQPAPEHDVAVVDPDTRERRPEGTVGEIWVRGPSVARGYWGRDAETSEAFAATLDGDHHGHWLRTGDLGVLDEGHLIVLGRRTDLLIVAGRNLYPSDVERTAALSHPALARGHAVAFQDEDGVSVMIEADRRSRDTDLDQVRRAVIRALFLEHGLGPRRVMVVAAHSIPVTASGKVRRLEARRLAAEGALRDLSETVYAE